MSSKDIKKFVYPIDTRSLMKTYTETSFDFPKNHVHFNPNKPFPLPRSTRADVKNNIS
jgi:hypothetical protein